MAKSLSAGPFEAIFDILWPQEKQSLCKEGNRLLKHFAVTRPADVSFLKPDDIVDLRSSGFAGIPEWEAFTSHISTCKNCRESLR
jgi:hypothetical protein